MASHESLELDLVGDCGVLPVEIIERVLSFLSIPELCRMRSVCRSWNELLSKPSFHDLYERDGKNRSFLFLTRDLDCDGWTVVDPVFRRTVTFLDLETQRWHSIPTGSSDADADEDEDEFETQLSAMDDGLICELSTLRGSDDDLALTIFDPVAKIRTALPAPPEIFSLGTYLPILLPAVDVPARSFTVFLVTNPREGNRDGKPPVRVHVYEPARSEWRALRNPPKEFEEAIAGSAVIFAHVLYIVFRDLREFVLLSYHLRDDAWTELRRIRFPKKLRHPQLVPRGNRLFMNAWSDSDEGALFKVSEILVTAGTTTITTAAQFTISKLRQLFEEQDLEFDIAYGIPSVDSSGACTSAVLMSSLSGKLISHDQRSGAASVLPANPLIHGCSEETYPAFDIFRGKIMKLSLRNLLSPRRVPRRAIS